MLRLTARTRKEIAALPGRYEVVERPVEWDPAKTALIICDVWDKHTCDNATRRTGGAGPPHQRLGQGPAVPEAP